VVLKTAAAHWFRPDAFLKIKERLKDPDESIQKFIFNKKSLFEENKLSYVKLIYEQLESRDDYAIRVESPYLSVYTDDYKLIEKLSNINTDLTKYIEVPAIENLQPGEVYSSRLNFKYKVHFGSTNQSYIEFVNWCDNNLKIKISRKAKIWLCKPRSFLGGYFYVKDDKTMTMVKIFLGSIIKKIETITKS
jgi:hypothetical protein